MNAPVSRISAMVSRWSLIAGVGVGIAAAGGGACGGGGKGSAYPDASVGSGGRTTTPGTGGSPGTVPDGGAPDGPAVSGNMRVFTGPARLLDTGASCSTPADTAADRWCAMLRPNATGTSSLWVFNLTRAMAGTAISCAAGDANCFQLTPAASAASFASHGFFGESFIYYDAQSIFAWRPGWTAGRVLLALDVAAQCQASPDAASVICVKVTATQGMLNLYAGTIAAQTGNPPALIEVIGTDGGLSFSRDSQSVLWSYSGGLGTPEVLKAQTIDAAVAPRTVASNVYFWSQTSDGGKWIWLANPVADANMFLTGTLQTAPYPAGTPTHDVLGNVLDYAAYAPSSAIVLSAPLPAGADLRAIANIDAATPTPITLAAQGPKQFVDLTPDGHVLYADMLAVNPADATQAVSNLRHVKTDVTGACAVEATADADPQASIFNDAGTAVSWVRLTVSTAGTLAATGLTSPIGGTTCTGAPFSTTLFEYLPTGTGLALVEGFSATTASGALRFGMFGTDGSLGARSTIDTAANAALASLFPGLPRLLYSVSAPVANAGIYISGALGAATAAFDPGLPGLPGAASGGGAGNGRGLSVGRPASSRAGAMVAARSSITAPGRRAPWQSVTGRFQPRLHFPIIEQLANRIGTPAAPARAPSGHPSVSGVATVPARSAR